ncbi:MAG: hypothetical protein R6X31_05655 [Anaerolineae bacterium]
MRLRGPDSVFSALVIALLLIGSLSCSSDPSGDGRAGTSGDSNTQSPESFGGAKFEVRAPFSTATVDIKPDGTVLYEASSPRTGIDRQTESKKASSDDVFRLMEAVQDADFFSLKASYPYQTGASYEDGSTYSIQVSIGGETKEVTCYESECPASFGLVMDAIREIWGAEILEVGV